jgi:Methyltransferase domain
MSMALARRSKRGALRRLGFGIATLFGPKPYGFFVPYRYAGRAQAANPAPAYPAAARRIEASLATMRQTIAWLAACAPQLAAIDGGAPPAPRWNQDWFAPLDAACLYAILRQTAPGRMLEIGSGHSTRFAARAIADGKLPTRLVCVDPHPRANLAGLAVQWIAATVQEAAGSPLPEFVAGDILFVDSSHVLMPGTDVDWILNRMLPALPRGALVHIHDMFLPDDYPAEWSWRGYNEAPAVAALLECGFEILFASHYAQTRLGSELPVLPAAVPGALASSLWLRKC